MMICIQVVSPSSPGSKDHDGSPDEHDELDDDHGQSRISVETDTDRLTGVDPAVPLGPLLVKVSPEVDGYGDLINMKTTFRVCFTDSPLEIRQQIPATYNQWAAPLGQGSLLK